MKALRSALCLAALMGFGMALAAQNDANQLSQASTKSSEKDKGKTVTLTGCLKEGTDANTFNLTNVSGKTPSAGSTSSTASSGAGDMTYSQTPATGVDLKAHVGHRVQVTGRMETGAELARTDPSS